MRVPMSWPSDHSSFLCIFAICCRLRRGAAAYERTAPMVLTSEDHRCRVVWTGSPPGKPPMLAIFAVAASTKSATLDVWASIVSHESMHHPAELTRRVTIAPGSSVVGEGTVYVHPEGKHMNSITCIFPG
jgi:hypothetical protein